jgi:hypothetical protein
MFVCLGTVITGLKEVQHIYVQGSLRKVSATACCYKKLNEASIHLTANST